MTKTNQSRVFITGDTHCPYDIHKLNSKCFPVGKTLNKNDIVIICGDAGFVFGGDKQDKWWINWISKKPWTTVYVDGNHENHPLLNSYPEVDFYGAKANKITDSLYHIKRGEIMVINDEKYFCFGGAFSHDIEYRIENVSWWQDELPVQEEVDNAINNLQKYHNQVDYIISHDVPTSINMRLGYNTPRMSYYTPGKYVHLCNFLQNILESVSFKAWFAGHYHCDELIGDVLILYQDIIEIKKQLNDNNEWSYYEKLDKGINEVRSKRYTEAELKQLFKQDNLYMTYSEIDTYDHFSHGENIIPAISFFDAMTTDEELEALSNLYNQYLIKKATRED